MNIRGRAVRTGAYLIGIAWFANLAWVAVPAAVAATADVPHSAAQPAAKHNSADKLLHAMPLYFVPNAGQADPAARFVARGRGYELDLRQDAMAITPLTGPRTGPPPIPIVLEFTGANSAAKVEGADPGAATINYLIGNDPKRWHRGLPTYRQVRYVNLYPGIDLVCYGAESGKLEYDLVVAPGADPQQIRFRVGSGHAAAVGADGDLHIDGPSGSLSLGQPVFYQNVAHGKQAIFGSFTASANGEFGFRAVKYDHTRPLVIDPPINILYSTYFGGSLDDEAGGMAIDNNGNSYVAGSTNSVDMLSTTNAFQPDRADLTANYQVTNAFIAKFDPSGTLLYGTYLGGSVDDWAAAIAVDKQGNAYITGLSSSSDFPTTANAFASASAYGNQMFIAEISPDGSTLEYSTIYGVPGGSASLANNEISSSDHEIIGNMGIALSAQNKIYVTASAFIGLPTSPTAYMPKLPGGYLGHAAFVAEFDPTQMGANQLLAASYFTAPTPSSGQNYSNTIYYGNFSYALTLDNNGNVWIGGQDQTGALPTTSNAYQKSVTLGNPSSICGAGSPVISAPWLAELSPDLSQLSYASYLSGGTAVAGTDCNEWIQGLASGTDGSIYAVGATMSASFPTTTGVLQPSYPGSSPSSFVSKFTPNGAALAWSTYLGQSEGAVVVQGAPFVDAQNNVWVGGLVTGSLGSNFPLTSNALTTTCSGQCAFVTGISSDGTGAIFSTTIGASVFPTFATGVGLDSAGNIHIAGTTTDGEFPLSSNAIQTQWNAGLAGGDEADWFFTILGSGTVSVVGSYVGGNDGDDTVTLVGTGFQQGATCSLVSGGTTIASSQSTVSPDGTQIICTFPLEGATLGNYSIVVTEPNGSTATNPNTFTVEQGQGPDVWVNLTGRSHLRSALPSTMTVTYGNSGDTDALGVPIFVTIPTGVTVQVLTTLLVPPNSDPLLMSTVPQTVTIGSNTVLPLLIPRIAAGTSGSVQIQITPPATDTDITLTAYNWEPIATSVSDLEKDLGTYQNGTFNTLLGASRLSFAPEVYSITLDPVAGSKCFQDVILLGLQVATNVNPVAPGLKCASSMVSFLGSAITALINSEVSSGYSSSDAASDLGQVYAGGAQAALNCVQTAAGSTPAGMAVNVIATFLQNAIPIANTLSDCSQVATINNSSSKNSTVGGAIDPNDKSGPIGDGSASQWIRQQGLTYNLAFENQPTATLPAAQVVITDQLNPALVNLSTFSLGLISFGGNTISVPSGTTSFSTLYSLNSSLSVQIQASLNTSTGLATWTFTSIDPSTGLPPTDPTVGFLPPDVNGIQGQGSVLFNVMPISSLTTGTQISNTASVVFDSNAAISTPTWLNTIDVTQPVSSVTALPATEVSASGQAAFNVSWSGTDVGSGIANYTIFVSVNGGAFTPWLVQTTQASASYTGTVGNTYGFYSISTDAAGNIEASKTAADTSTQVAPTPTTTVVTNPNATANPGASVTFTATVTPTTGTGVPTGTVTFFDSATQLGTGTLSSGAATYTTSSLATGTHSITAQYSGDADDDASTSSVFTQTIAAPTFALSANPTSLTLAQGATGSVTITATPAGGFSQQITFTCSGLPAYATCAFSPATLTPSGSPISTTLTIATDVKTTALDGVGNAPGSSSTPPIVLAILGFGLLPLFRRRRRVRMTAGWLSSTIIAILLSIPLIFACGCGGGQQKKTPTGNSQITVSASGGDISQTVTIAVVVQ